MADPENQGTNPEKAPEKQSSGGGGQIGFTMEYVTSIPGIIKIVEFVSSPIPREIPRNSAYLRVNSAKREFNWVQISLTICLVEQC